MKRGEKKRRRLERHMIRPFIYLVFTRFLLGLALGLLADFFLRPMLKRDLREPAFLILALLFGLMAVIAWMRMDGLKLPKLMTLRLGPRKKPVRTYGDIPDHLDEEPVVTFEDLEDEEKDFCLLAADALCALLFLIAAIIV